MSGPPLGQARKRSWRAAAAAAAVLALVPGAHASISLELRFDGQPFESEAPPEFTCFNATRGPWVACRAQKAEAPGAWLLERPEAGAYRMHVSIDDNPVNPRRFPGDFEAQMRFEVGARADALPGRQRR